MDSSCQLWHLLEVAVVAGCALMQSTQCAKKPGALRPSLPISGWKNNNNFCKLQKIAARSRVILPGQQGLTMWSFVAQHQRQIVCIDIVWNKETFTGAPSPTTNQHGTYVVQ